MRIGEPGTGITGWTLAGIPTGTTSIDGLPTRAEAPVGTESVAPPVVHPNHAIAIDHVVVWSVDDARTIDALVAAGFEVRRVREDARPGMRQTFVRAGEVIIELVTRADREPPADPQPARFFGIACTVADLDAAHRSSVTRSVRSPTRCSRAGASRRFEARRSDSKYRSRS